MDMTHKTIISTLILKELKYKQNNFGKKYVECWLVDDWYKRNHLINLSFFSTKLITIFFQMISQ